MPTPEDFVSENYRIYWPAILAVFVVQVIVSIVLSIAVANHSNFATASRGNTKANLFSVGIASTSDSKIAQKCCCSFAGSAIRV
jgi:hypothetical protein